MCMQVLQTLRSNVPARKINDEDHVSVYLPTACKEMDVNERKLKENVKDVGGGWNGSCLFLPKHSTASAVTSITGTSKKSAVKIPRSKVPTKLLRKQDYCKLMVNGLLYLSTKFAKICRGR